MPDTSVQRFPYSLLRGAAQSAFGTRMVHAIGGLARRTKLAKHRNETVHIPRRDGTGTIRTKVYTPEGTNGDLPILVYFHGGGYVVGVPEGSHFRMRLMQEAYPCVIVAPDYRVTLEAPFPAGHDDCYDTLLWAADNAGQIGGRADQLILAGDSAGGGLTLSTALRARDEGKVHVAAQVPIYPMIDDRPENWTKLDQSLLLWTETANQQGWDLLLKGHAETPVYAAPARATDVAGLPPMLSFCGDQDLFLDENRAFFGRMKDAGCDVTYAEFEDTWHAMEVLNPRTPRSRDINSWFTASYADLMTRICGPSSQ